jgi:two-component system, response regulator YesN
MDSEINNKSFSILVVDDELVSRRFIKKIIENNIEQVDKLEFATDGHEAIKKNLEIRPDVIIMDIQMPGINGLEASKQIFKDRPEVYLLLLTAHESFEYAQMAIEFGIKSYLLKPVKKADLIRKINSIKEEIFDKEKIKQERINEHNQIKSYIEKEFLSSIIVGHMSKGDIKRFNSFFRKNLDKGFFMVIKLNKNSDFVIKLLENYDSSFFLKSNVGTNIILFIPENNSSVSDSISFAEKLKIYIEESVKSKSSIGIGSVKTGIPDLKYSYFEAVSALDNALKTNSIIHYNNISINDFNEHENIDTYKAVENFIESLISANNKVEVSAKVNEYINELLNNYDDIIELKEIIIEYFSVLKLRLKNQKINFNIDIYKSLYPEISSFNSREEIKKWFIQKLDILIDDFFYSMQNKIDYKFHQIFQYINKHKFNEISLKSAADKVGISPQYLSRYFKEKYGQNFITYIKKSKFDLAKSLLVSSNEKISSISKKVGYWDYKYFCKIFKKHTGFTPSEYRSKFKTV